MRALPAAVYVARWAERQARQVEQAEANGGWQAAAKACSFPRRHEIIEALTLLTARR